MQPEPVQRLHLLRRHHIAGVQAVDPGHAGADPAARHFAFGGVVRRQPDMALVGGVQRGDLPGQVVVPRPRRQLVDRHRHTPHRPYAARYPITSAAERSLGASGVSRSDRQKSVGVRETDS